MGKEANSVNITDTHLDDDNFDFVYSVHKQAIKLAKSLGLDFVNHLGDHFTNRASQKLDTLLNFKKIIRLYEKAEITLYTIAGNHDKTDQSISESYLDIFSSEYMINLDGQCFCHKKVIYHFLAFYTDAAYDEKLMQLIDDNWGDEDVYSNVLLTHFGIDGVIDNDDRKVTSTIKKSRFNAFDRVLIGHYHNASDVNETIRYIGSTDPRNYGEDSLKGATILYDDMSLELYPFEFKGFEKIIIEEFDFANMDELIELHANENTNVRIEFRGDPDKLIKVDKKKLNEAGIDVITIDTKLINVADTSEEASATIGMERKDILKHLDEYSKDNKIPRKKLAKIIKLF